MSDTPATPDGDIFSGLKIACSDFLVSGFWGEVARSWGGRAAMRAVHETMCGRGSSTIKLCRTHASIKLQYYGGFGS